ncbi:MAG: DUF5318 family protein [Acidimicrobiaceae bacterium]|nr:DUF5318 family protein [Acidimicrobiaceae bacterium]MYA13998.1 hypothetical protein [Acidimicrobiaceae bacterium]MYE64317.1 hypothetical protein [Acidimicrobiaceae bacterium]
MKPSPSKLATAGRAAAPGQPVAAAVDYRLARAATLRAWRSGQLGRHEVCDAQRELQRNAEFCGQPTGRSCPVCDSEGAVGGLEAERPVSAANKSGNLVEVTYVFGSRLPKHGRCVTTRAEMQRLQHRVSVSTGYVVEVCTVCGWNHLVRRFTLGGRRSA